MYCPHCLTEYRDGFFECADCRAPLAPGRPPAPAEPPALELVTVLETQDSFALTLAKASLDEAGIGYLIIGDDPQRSHIALVHGANPLCKCSCRIQVAREYESEARTLLEPLQYPDPAAGLDAEESDV